MYKWFELVRIKQYYKNFLIFLPIIFAAELSNLAYLGLTVVGFVSLCLISSTNYIINDIVDKERDREHPEKKFRPVASGSVKVWQAIILAAILFLVSTFVAYRLTTPFLYSVLFLFFFTQVYTFFLKKELFADVLAIGVNFVVRAVSGALIIFVRVSPWLILCTFFLSLFLSSSKREADLRFLSRKAGFHKEVLKEYNLKLTNFLMVTSTTALVISYSLYTFLSIYPLLIFSLPFALYVIFRYLHLVCSGSEVARHPEKLFLKDARLMYGLVLWFLTVLTVIYLT